MAGREETTEVTGMLMRRRRWGRKNSRRTAGGQGSGADKRWRDRETRAGDGDGNG